MNAPDASSCMFCARDPHRAAARALDHLAKREKRGADDDVVLGGRDPRQQRIDELRRLGDGLVHLPVAANDLGRVLGSRSLSGIAQRLDPGQHLSLEQLQRGAASGRDPIDPVGKPELAHGGHRVAAADDRHAGRRARPPRRRLRVAAAKRLELEHAHRAVPEHGLGRGDRLRVGDDGAGADVEAHPAVRHLDPVALAALGRLRQSARQGRGRRGAPAHLGALGALERLGSEPPPSSSTSESPVAIALGAEEAVGHRAADQNPVGDLEEAVDDLDLVGDLGAAEDDDERPRRRVDDRASAR